MRSIVMLCLGVVAVTFALGVYAALTAVHVEPQSREQASSPSVPEDLLAYTLCSNAVKKQLKAPSTAVFADVSERASQIKTTGAHTYAIESYVDAENSYGAKIRTQWSCTIEIDGQAQYRIVSLDLQ